MATSFYGGLAGTSFVLKARFSTYTDMVNAFKQGDSYTDVWYGEYCIIDTVNKNHRENGKIWLIREDTESKTDRVYYGKFSIFPF